MGQYLDDNGLRYLWTKIKNIFVEKETGKGLSSNDYTTTEKNKLAGIANNANNYSLPTASASTLGGIKVGSGLSIDNGVLSASGGQSLRVIQESDEAIILDDYDIHYINIPSNSYLVYLEGGPGDPLYDALDESEKFPARGCILIGGSIDDFSYPISAGAWPVTAKVSYATGSNRIKLQTSGNVFYLSSYKVLGI